MCLQNSSKIKKESNSQISPSTLQPLGMIQIDPPPPFAHMTNCSKTANKVHIHKYTVQFVLIPPSSFFWLLTQGGIQSVGAKLVGHPSYVARRGVLKNREFQFWKSALDQGVGRYLYRSLLWGDLRSGIQREYDGIKIVF